MAGPGSRLLLAATLALAFVLGLVVSRPRPALGQDDPLATATGQVMQLLAEGRTLEATRALVTGFATLPPADHEAWFFFAARTCLQLGSTFCGRAVLGQPLILDFTPERIYPQTAGALVLLVAWVKARLGDEADARRLAENGTPKAIATPLSNPVLFAEFALLSAQQARVANNFAGSRAYLDQALAATLGSAKPDLGLLLGIHLVLSRTLQSRADDTLATLARYRTDAGRRAVQGLYTTDLQRVDWETAELEALGRRLAARPPQAPTGARLQGPPGQAAERAAIVAAAGDFTKRQRSLRAALVTPPGGSPDGVLVGVRALQHQLQADEALLFYVPLLDGDLAKVCLRRDLALARTEPMQPGDRDHADRLMEALLSDAPSSGADDLAFPVASAVRLDRILLHDLAPCLATARRVFFVPPAGLRRVPPGALLAEAPPSLGSGYDLRAAHWRVRDHAFVQATSISAFTAARRLAGTRTAGLDYLGIGDPVLPRPVLGNVLPELPEASQELQAVAGLFPAGRARVLRRDGATERQLREAPADAYDVLHFATHGLTRHDLPELAEPGLALAAGPDGDGFLPASRIATLPLHARLVVLSACNSARFDALLTDRGIQGLATAFTLAGVPSMIAALWPIDSALARDTIVATFAAARRDGDLGIADALALAVRRHLDGPTPRPLLHPRYWASLVAMGDGAMRLASASSPP